MLFNGYIYRFAGILFLLTIFSKGIAPQSEKGELKKVVILPFNNLNDKADFTYLENSISDSISTSLKKRFLFQEISREEWKLVANKNYIYPMDFFTQTASMNLGLLSKQDIVISGGFTTEESRDRVLLHIFIKIYDISAKKILSDLVIDGEASSNIFKTMDEVTQKVESEASKVLPNREEWQKQSLKTGIETYVPFFSNVKTGVSVGAGFFFLGWADNVSARPPAISISLRADFARISFAPFIQFQLDYMSHEINPDSTSNLAMSGISMLTSDFMPGIYLGKDFSLSDNLILSPMIGLGYLFQSINLTGSFSETLFNGMFFASIIPEFSWKFNKHISAVISPQIVALFEENNFTMAAVFKAGVNLGF